MDGTLKEKKTRKKRQNRKNKLKEAYEPNTNNGLYDIQNKKKRWDSKTAEVRIGE